MLRVRVRCYSVRLSLLLLLSMMNLRNNHFLYLHLRRHLLEPGHIFDHILHKGVCGSLLKYLEHRLHHLLTRSSSRSSSRTPMARTSYDAIRPLRTSATTYSTHTTTSGISTR